MQFAKESNIIAIKLEDGDNLTGALETALAHNMVKSGIILGGIGMIADFKIGFYNGKEYEAQEFADPHELLSLQGSVAQIEGGKTMLHLHVCAGARDHHVVGGHLIGAKVKNMTEIFVMRLTDIELRRRKNEKIGLMEMEFHKASEIKLPHTTKHKSGSMELDTD